MEHYKSVDNAHKSIQHIQNFKTLEFTNQETAYQKVFKTQHFKGFNFGIGKNTTRLVNHLRGRAKGESFSIFYDPFTAWIHEVENYLFR